MESSGPAAPGLSSSVSIDRELNGFNEAVLVQALAQGTTLFVRMDQKAMLVKIMEALGARTAPICSRVQCGENGFRLSIKLDVTGFRSVDGECIGFSEVFGETSLNPSTAETSAVLRAFKILQNTHHIKIVDFSSRVVQKLESYNLYNLVVQAMHSTKIILDGWEMACRHSQNFVVHLQPKQLCDNAFGRMTDEAKVYAVPGDCLSSTTMNFNVDITDARSKIIEFENGIRRYENSTSLLAKKLSQKVYLKEVDLPSKDVLDHVLFFFGHEKAKYSHCQGDDGLLHSSVQLKIPYCYIVQYGPLLTITGKGATEAESHENAAYEALLMLERNFPVKIIDFNHSTKLQTIKNQNFLFSMLSATLELGQELRKMWSELSSAIDSQNAMFRLDPKTFFVGNMAEAQIGAYKFCATGLEELRKNSSNLYASCAPHFDNLVKLRWQFLSLHSIMDNYSL